jgi:tRNA1(Val) A37 N6-methylase TrmN6
VTEPDTRDAFLGGRLHLWQPRRGYRAGIDPVLLAAAVPAKPGQSVLDLGCGVGAAALCLHCRVPELALTGVERQGRYADLARRNAAAAQARMEVVEADLTALPSAQRQQQFDHVIANPPYYQPQTRSRAADAGREAALAEDTPLERWIDVAARRLAPKGMVHLIQRANRLPALLAAIQTRLGSPEILPIAPRADRAAELILLRARKGGRAAFRLHAPLILHDGPQHVRDEDSYRPEISAVLRDAAPLGWPGAQHG